MAITVLQWLSKLHLRPVVPSVWEKMSSPSKTPHQSKFIGTGSLQAYCICRGFSCELLLFPFLSDATTDCLSTPIEDKWRMMTGTRLKHYHPFAWPLRFLMSIMQMSSELELFWWENICNLCCISCDFFSSCCCCCCNFEICLSSEICHKTKSALV